VVVVMVFETCRVDHLQVLVCPDKRRPEENKGNASLGYGTQVCVLMLFG